MVNLWILGSGVFLGGGDLLFCFCFGFCSFWLFLRGKKGEYCIVSPDGYSRFLWSTESDV